uniref:hypothetical protein n=1 Tax=Acetatifactor sp. TaxID=1872090 RepID=UPI004028362C
MNTSEEKKLIASLQSPDCSAEQRSEIIYLLWKNNENYVRGQIFQFFSQSPYVDYEEVLSECLITFCEFLDKFDLSRNSSLQTALCFPLKHTLYIYMCSENGFTSHENQVCLRLQTIFDQYSLTGQENINELTLIYNSVYPQNTITPKSMYRYLRYYSTKNKVRIDSIDHDVIPTDFSTEHYVALMDLREHLSECAYSFINSDEQSLLLYIFRLTDHVEVNGTVYPEDCSHLTKSVFKKPLSKFINCLLARMCEMNLISHANENSFYNFLHEYYADSRYFNMF